MKSSIDLPRNPQTADELRDYLTSLSPAEQKAYIEARRMFREELEYAEKQDEKRKAYEESLKAVQIEMAEKQAKQDGCSHSKENGRTAYAGQKTGDGRLVLVCQFCFKTAHSLAEIPENARMTLPEIGGPA